MQNKSSSPQEMFDLDRLRLEFRNNRIEAGLLIDPETCEIAIFTVDFDDPYELFPDPAERVGRSLFVRSPESDGWVSVYELPDFKLRALNARIDRKEEPITADGVRDVVLEKHVGAVAVIGKSMDDLAEFFPGVPSDIFRHGVCLALAEASKKQDPRLQEWLGLNGETSTASRDEHEAFAGWD
jgi:hypothetical protein